MEERSLKIAVERSSNPALLISRSISLSPKTLPLHGTISGSRPRISPISTLVISAIGILLRLEIQFPLGFLEGSDDRRPCQFFGREVLGIRQQVHESLYIVDADWLVAAQSSCVD